MTLRDGDPKLPIPDRIRLFVMDRYLPMSHYLNRIGGFWAQGRPRLPIGLEGPDDL